MRDPAIHITRSRLLTILIQHVDANAPVEEWVDVIVSEAKKYALSGRTEVSVKGGARARKVVRAAAAAKEDVELFNRTLHAIRQIHAPQVAMRVMRATDNEYQTLLEVVGRATDFCTHFGYEHSYGFPKYIKHGTELMGKKYMLSKFLYLSERITNREEAVNTIASVSPAALAKFYLSWKDVVLKYVGSVVDVSKDMDKMCEFVYAYNDATEMLADYSTWVEAQFEGLRFMNAIPELSQLHGTGAKQRYQKYLYSKAAKTEAETSRYVDDQERWYFEVFLPQRVKEVRDAANSR